MPRIDIDTAVREGRDFLFDTSVLINWYKEVAPRAGSAAQVPAAESAARIPHNRRFVTELVRWEFLTSPSGLPRVEVSKREHWLRENGVQWHRRPAAYDKTFQAIVSMTSACGSAVDASQVAVGVASLNLLPGRGSYVIATINRHHFEWHRDVYLVQEFLPPA